MFTRSKDSRINHCISKTCDCIHNNNYYLASFDKVAGKRVTPKKVVLSKKVHPNYANGTRDGKSCSTGIIHIKKIPSNANTTKKNTKSDGVINKIGRDKCPFDYCKRCGDVLTQVQRISSSHSREAILDNKEKKELLTTKDNSKISKLVKQYYKNENFRPSTESVGEIDKINNGLKKISLDTIKELPEARVSNEAELSKKSIIQVYSDIEEVGYLDTENEHAIKKLKEFRDNNYFECHSVKSRIESKVSVTSLTDHKCTYRFYLNDRLFPVPIRTDHQGNIRCVECHLPLNLKNEELDIANGSIQAKIKIGEESPQDAVLFLPVKDQLIIKERRKEPKKEEEVMYFGVIKLSADGNSIFNKTLPSNSFALRYQKGYQEYHQNNTYKYETMDKDDVVVI